MTSLFPRAAAAAALLTSLAALAAGPAAPAASPSLKVPVKSPPMTAPAPAAKADDDPLLAALTEELARSFKALGAKRDAAAKGEQGLYYLSYRLNDGQWFQESASFGAIEAAAPFDDPLAGRARYLDVAARVGSRALDNTHQVRDELSFGGSEGSGVYLPIEDDLPALKVGIWRATDAACKGAVKQFIKVKANRAVKVEEEDKADDFSQEKAQVHVGPRETARVDRGAWRDRLRRLSSIFKEHPKILRSSVGLQAGTTTMYFVDSEGSRVREGRFYARVMIAGAVKADDGMDLDLYDSFEAKDADLLPTEAQVEEHIRALIARLEALRVAKVVEPYSGPAIISNRAAAVFFHEIFGHRVEGHRQKDEDEGHTFTRKIGQQVLPEFLSVVDDPTRSTYGRTYLNGYYQYDDEGVPAQAAQLVQGGVLKGFLLGRSPINGFPRSNGHGRAQPGMQPVARQGNLIVESTRTVPFAQLREMLIAEAKKRGKPYGLIFDDIAGGFTFTRAGSLPQAFKVMPLVVTRVFADGRPDELVRGVDMVGTPLASFEKILATGDDPAVFNGFCGAESGFVPVSGVAPSLLVAEIEVERRAKGHERPPLLPPPLKAPTAKSVAQGVTPW
ncbi:MAG TPA: metallopeptidase TldD-related protein [Myxococcales bacterium]|nr:metallopeptidase TldD-related protein [Myxococcales bacterium]